MDILKKVVDGIKAIAPSVANYVMPGSGPILYGLMRKVSGAPENTPIEQVAAMIDQNPTMFLELKRLCLDAEVRLAEISAGRLETVNRTMRAEAKSERWPQYSWRPVNGFAFPVAVILIYFVLPLCQAVVPDIPQWVWIGWLSILGVATWDRGKEKRAKAGDQGVGILASAIQAIKG